MHGIRTSKLITKRAGLCCGDKCQIWTWYLKSNQCFHSNSENKTGEITKRWQLTLFHLVHSWWRHQKETLSALPALCAGNSPVTGEFPSQRPVTRSFGIFGHMRLNKRLSKQSWGWWFETPSRSLWHCNVGFRRLFQMCATRRLSWHQLLLTFPSYYLPYRIRVCQSEVVLDVRYRHYI